MFYAYLWKGYNIQFPTHYIFFNSESTLSIFFSINILIHLDNQDFCDIAFAFIRNGSILILFLKVCIFKYKQFTVLFHKKMQFSRLLVNVTTIFQYYTTPRPLWIVNEGPSYLHIPKEAPFNQQIYMHIASSLRKKFALEEMEIAVMYAFLMNFFIQHTIWFSFGLY